MLLLCSGGENWRTLKSAVFRRSEIKVGADSGGGNTGGYFRLANRIFYVRGLSF